MSTLWLLLVVSIFRRIDYFFIYSVVFFVSLSLFHTDIRFLNIVFICHYSLSWWRLVKLLSLNSSLHLSMILHMWWTLLRVYTHFISMISYCYYFIFPENPEFSSLWLRSLISSFRIEWLLNKSNFLLISIFGKLFLLLDLLSWCFRIVIMRLSTVLFHKMNLYSKYIL